MRGAAALVLGLLLADALVATADAFVAGAAMALVADDSKKEGITNLPTALIPEGEEPLKEKPETAPFPAAADLGHIKKAVVPTVPVTALETEGSATAAPAAASAAGLVAEAGPARAGGHRVGLPQADGPAKKFSLKQYNALVLAQSGVSQTPAAAGAVDYSALAGISGVQAACARADNKHLRVAGTSTGLDGMSGMPGASDAGMCGDPQTDGHAICVNALPARYCGNSKADWANRETQGQDNWCQPFEGDKFCVDMWWYARDVYVNQQCIAVDFSAIDHRGVCKYLDDMDQHWNSDIAHTAGAEAPAPRTGVNPSIPGFSYAKAKECLKCHTSGQDADGNWAIFTPQGDCSQMMVVGADGTENMSDEGHPYLIRRIIDNLGENTGTTGTGDQGTQNNLGKGPEAHLDDSSLEWTCLDLCQKDLYCIGAMYSASDGCVHYRPHLYQDHDEGTKWLSKWDHRQWMTYPDAPYFGEGVSLATGGGGYNCYFKIAVEKNENCRSSAVEPLKKACKCQPVTLAATDDTTCDVGKYCFDGKCTDKLDASIGCRPDPYKPILDDCKCIQDDGTGTGVFTETACDAGKYCFDGKCGDYPQCPEASCFDEGGGGVKHTTPCGGTFQESYQGLHGNITETCECGAHDGSAWTWTTCTFVADVASNLFCYQGKCESYSQPDLEMGHIHTGTSVGPPNL